MVANEQRSVIGLVIITGSGMILVRAASSGVSIVCCFILFINSMGIVTHNMFVLPSFVVGDGVTKGISLTATGGFCPINRFPMDFNLFVRPNKSDTHHAEIVLRTATKKLFLFLS